MFNEPLWILLPLAKWMCWCESMAALWKCDCPWSTLASHQPALETPLWNSLLPCGLVVFSPLSFVWLHNLSRFRTVLSAWIPLSLYVFELPSAFPGFFSVLFLLLHCISPYRTVHQSSVREIKVSFNLHFPFLTCSVPGLVSSASVIFSLLFPGFLGYVMAGFFSVIATHLGLSSFVLSWPLS